MNLVTGMPKELLMVAAVWMAFADKVELNIQNYHSGFYDILQVAPSSYRSGAGFRKRKN